MKRILTLLVAIVTVFSLNVLVPAVSLAATSTSTVCETLGGGVDCTSAPVNSVDIWDIIRRITDIVTLLVGIVAVIMIVMGGFKFITSGGDAAKAKSARSTIMYAIAGLVVVAIAQLIVNVVLKQSSGL